MKIIYIAGPMRGIPHYNFPAFDAAERRLRAEGFDVRNPAQMDREVGFDAMTLPADSDWSAIPPNFDFDACLHRDVDAVMESDAIFMLDGWRRSRGAVAEKSLAEWRGLEVRYQTPPSAPLPEDSAERKTYPLYRGLFQYFPRALAAIAHHSYISNEKHNPGEPLHWSREKSNDHADCLLRHVLEGDWIAAAWRALAQLETVLDSEPNDNAELAAHLRDIAESVDDWNAPLCARPDLHEAARRLESATPEAP